MSQFDPESFLNITVDESNDTVLTPVPAGEYVALVDDIKARSWQKKDDPSIAGMALDVTWSIDDAGVKATLGRDKVTVKQGLMLDVTDTGGLDMGKGKNVDLGRLREALSLNEKGQSFSFLMMKGRPAKVIVKHRIDPNDSSKVYAEVKAVAKLA